jgi:hypothetical protein
MTSRPLTTLTTTSLISGEVKFIPAAADSANAPSPLIDWLSEKVDGVEDTVELLECELEQRHGDGGVRARRGGAAQIFASVRTAR